MHLQFCIEYCDFSEWQLFFNMNVHIQIYFIYSLVQDQGQVPLKAMGIHNPPTRFQFSWLVTPQNTYLYCTQVYYSRLNNIYKKRLNAIFLHPSTTKKNEFAELNEPLYGWLQVPDGQVYIAPVYGRLFSVVVYFKKEFVLVPRSIFRTRSFRVP